MSHQSKAIFLLLTIVAVLLASAVGTTNVYADDGTPPPPPTETGEVDPSTGEAEPVATEPAVVVPPVEETELVATEVPVTEPLDEAVASEEAPVVEEVPVVEEQQPAEAETAPILEQVPDNTTVTVLNTEGEAQPLTSQESADAILTSDPIWCPQYVLPVPETNGCTKAYSSFKELLDFLKANETNAAYQQNGTIYVQMGTYTGPAGETDFNSYDFTSLNNYDLTIQGGWDPVDNSTNPTDTTQLNVPIIIGTSTNPWVGSLTLNNIYISNVSNQTGLTLYSQKSITLDNVQVTNSLGGADLNAGAEDDGGVIVQNSKFNHNRTFGAKINTDGFVFITDSEFNNNAYSKDQYDGYGLEIDSQGDVYLGTVNASFNEKFGADINSAATVSVWNSVFNGNLSYTHNCGYKACNDCTEKPNGGYGLKIVSTSEVSLEAVNANDNYLFGADLQGTDVSVIGGTVNGVFKTSTFNGNGSDDLKDPKGYGLKVVATGKVTLSDMEANNNQLFGADITAVGDVKITNSFFDGNKSYYNSCTSPKRSCEECKTTYYGYGLQVVTTGDIELNTVSASKNYLFGAHLKGADVSISNGTFSNNSSGSSSVLTGEGLKVESTENVTLSNVAANNNQLFGGDILAVGDVNITLSTFNGQQVFSGTKMVGGGYGLQAIATGETSQINLTAVTASDNYLYGMHLSAYNVKIAGLGSEYTRAERNKEGIKIEATGAVSIDMLQANNNKLFGATILSGTNEAFDGTVLITNSFFSGNASYTSSSCKGKKFYGYGLKVITTADDITLTNVTANDNHLYGAHLEGANIDVSQSVFSSNGTDNKADHIGKGLEIVSVNTASQSTVSLTDVSASNNQLFGANIQAEGFVFVNTSVFNGNQSYTVNKCGCKTYDGYGIKIVTTGSAYLYGVEAQQNYLFGGHVEGAYVSVSNSVFSNNVSPTHKGKTPTGRGLEVKSTGDVSLTDVDASNNQLFGATIEAGGAVSVISSTFMNNKYYTYTSCKGTKSAGYGLKIVTTDPAKASPIVLSGVEASSNGAEGAILQGESTVNVANSTFNSNGADGLNITASGNVTLNNVTADGNKGDGVDVKGVCTNTVYVNGGTFTDNRKYGIKVIDAIFTPDNTQTFGGNGSGNVFHSGCVTTNSNASNSSTSQNNSGQSWNSNYGHGQWYWQGHR